MAYRHDKDLEFLKKCSNEDLDILVSIITKDKDGNTRLTEELTHSETYKKHCPNHRKYWELIVSEIQCFGSNTFMTLCRRGKGVLYREILTDVCGRMKVKYDRDETVEKIEMKLILSILSDSLGNMTEKQIKDLAKDLDLKTASFAKQAVLASIQSGVAVSGFMAYEMSAIVANAVARAILGRGLTFATNAGLTRLMGVVAGPVGWAITAIWTATDIAGPAYRVTIPSVIQVAFLRAKLKYQLPDNKLKIALFGQPGSGKSSIINAIIGKKVVENGVSTDKTVEAKQILWKNILLVDLPGYDTSKFPKDSFLKKFSISSFDIFVCVFSNKLHHADVEFFTKLSQNNQTCIFVRNRHDELWEEDKAIFELERDIRDDVNRLLNRKVKVVFTSCKNRTGIENLKSEILSNLDEADKTKWIKSFASACNEHY